MIRSMIPILLTFPLMLVLAIFLRLSPTLAKASSGPTCLWQCDTSTYGYDESSWPIEYQSYDLEVGTVECDYGTNTPSESTETIPCALNATTGIDLFWPGGHYYYCPYTGYECCAPSVPAGESCIITFSCPLDNPLSASLNGSTTDVIGNTLSCTYDGGIAPCVYDLNTGCLLQQQGIFQCPGTLSWECVSTSVSSTSTSTPVSSTTSLSTTSTTPVSTTPSSSLSPTSSASLTSSTPLPTATLPAGWALSYVCAEDNPSRILSRVVGYTLANNTPANCASICASGNYGWAGVEYGDECFCGTSDDTNGEYPTSIDASDCSMPCAGDSSQTCGGSWAMQVYQWNNLAEAEAQYDVPAKWASWNNVADGENCFVDDAQRVLPSATSTTLTNNGPGTCIAFCASGNYTLAGLEYGDECWCGVNYPGWTGPNSTATYTCDTPCPEAPNLDCGGSWSMKLYYQDA